MLSKWFCGVLLFVVSVLFVITSWLGVQNARAGDYPALAVNLICLVAQAVIIGFQINLIVRET